MPGKHPILIVRERCLPALVKGGGGVFRHRRYFGILQKEAKPGVMGQ